VGTTNQLDGAGVAAYAARRYSLLGRAAVSDPELKISQRVWLLDWVVPSRRRYGRIVYVDSTDDLLRGNGMTILIEDVHVVISRTLEGRGVEWDVAEEPK